MEEPRLLAIPLDAGINVYASLPGNYTDESMKTSNKLDRSGLSESYDQSPTWLSLQNVHFKLHLVEN